MKLHIFETLEVSSAHLHIKSGEEFNLTDISDGDIISISSTDSLLEKPDGSKVLAISVKRGNVQLMFLGSCPKGDFENGTFKAPSVAIATTNPKWWDDLTVKGILAEVFPLYNIDFNIIEGQEQNQFKIIVTNVHSNK